MNNLVTDENRLRTIKRILIAISIILVIFIIALGVLIVSRHRKVSDIDTFEKTLQNDGYTITNETYRYSSNKSVVITAAYLAQSDSCNIRLIELSNEEYASKFFDMSKASYEKQKQRGSVVSELFVRNIKIIHKNRKQWQRYNRSKWYYRF